MKLLHGQGEIVAERYQIVTLLGQGGMGSTYAAVDLKTNQRVAIKVVSLRAARDWKTLELFEREAQVLANLNHPFIPKYLDYFQVDADKDSPNSDCRFYLVQELVEGESLATLVERGWQPKEAEVKEIAMQVLDILVYLHTLVPPIIHRDIKPQNLIRREDGKVYLVDFGTVQHIVRNPQSFVSTFVGSVGYMPPEQLRGQTVFASDLYSLGATLIFLLTGQSPETLPQKMLKVDFRQVIKLSEEFAQWLDGAITPVIEDRFQSAQEALLQLKGKIQFKLPKNQTVSHTYNPRIKVQKYDNKLVVKIDGKKREISTILWNFLLPLVLFLIIMIIFLFTGNWDRIISSLIIILLWSLSLLPANCLKRETYLEINSETFRIKWTYLFIDTHQVQGRTEDIVEISQNGTQCILWEGIKPHCCIDDKHEGSKLELNSQDIAWLVAEINNFLRQLQS